MINVDHICTTRDKYCREGMSTGRHDPELPWAHPDQHNTHKGGCICTLGETPLQGRIRAVRDQN
jgi:hypothetical protein